MAGEDSKRPWLAFLKDMFIDGYKLIGASAPVLSIDFTIAKALDLHIGLENISYAWGLLPLSLWVLIACWRRWLVSRITVPVHLTLGSVRRSTNTAGWNDVGLALGLSRFPKGASPSAMKMEMRVVRHRTPSVHFDAAEQR